MHPLLIVYLVGMVVSFRFSGKWFYQSLSRISPLDQQDIGGVWVIAILYSLLSWVGFMLAWIQGGPRVKLVSPGVTKKVFGIK